MFKEAVEHIIKENEKMIIVSGVVKKLRDEDCDISRTGQPDILNVQFKSILKNTDSYFIIVPKEESVVLVGIIENDPSTAVLISCSEIKKTLVKIGDTEFRIEKNGFVVKQDEDSLKDVWNDFFTEFKNLAGELKKVFVSIGTTPNIPAIELIEQRVETMIKPSLNNILIE